MIDVRVRYYDGVGCLMQHREIGKFSASFFAGVHSAVQQNLHPFDGKHVGARADFTYAAEGSKLNGVVGHGGYSIWTIGIKSKTTGCYDDFRA